MALPDINALTKFGDPAQFEQMQSNAAKRNKKTFGTAFLNALTGRINESRAEAKEWYKEEKLRAQRNLPLVQKREAQKKQVLAMAQTLKTKFGQGDDEFDDKLMFFLKDGVPAFTANYNQIMKLDQKMANEGLTLTPETVSQMMILPAEYKDSDQDLTSFVNQMYSNAEALNKEAPPRDESSFFDNIVLGANGFSSMSRAERRLATEKGYGDLSYDQINRLAALGDTTVDPFGGTYTTANLDLQNMPYILDRSDMSSAQSEFNTLHKELQKEPKEAERWLKQNYSTAEVDEYLGTIVKSSTSDDYQRVIPVEVANAWVAHTGKLAANEILKIDPRLERALDQLPDIKKYYNPEVATFSNNTGGEDDNTSTPNLTKETEVDASGGENEKREQKIKELQLKQEQVEEQKKLEKEFKTQFRGAAPGTEDKFNVTSKEYKKLLVGEEVNGNKYVKGAIYYLTDVNMYAIEKDDA